MKVKTGKQTKQTSGMKLSKQLPAELLYKLIDTLPGHVCWKDTDGLYTGCNQAFADTLQLSSTDEIIGKSDYDFLSPNNAALIQSNDRLVMDQKISKEFIESAIDKDGKSTTYISKKDPLLSDDGQVIGMTCVAFNLDDHFNKLQSAETAKGKQSDFIKKMRYLDIIADWLPGNVYWRSVDGTTLGNNANMKKILKHFDWDVMGEKCYDFLPEEEAKQLLETDMKVMRSGVADTVQEEGYDQHGNKAAYMSNKVPLRDESGKVVGLVGISIDITERIRLEESLKEAKEKAELSNKAKNDFLMNMSHDLRTPFTGIMGSAELLYQSEADPERKEMLDIILQSAKRVLGLIDEIIDIASLEPHGSSNQQLFKPQEVCDNLTAIMRPQVEHIGLAFKTRVDPSIPTKLYGNKMALHRVLLNLLGNAIKFTPEGEITLTVEQLPSDDDNLVTLKLTVTDTGIGIPKKSQNMIFEKFHRLTPASEGRYKGSGLGLFFVKSEVEAMNGTVEIESTVGKGSKFVCIIPFPKSKRAADRC